MQTGRGDFFLGSQRYSLEAGTGLFINSQVIHRFEAAQSTVIPNLVFSPTLLSPQDSLVYQKYIRPVLESPSECLIFSSDSPLFPVMTSLFSLQSQSDPCEIQTVETLLRLWNLIYDQIGRSPASPVPPSSARSQAQLQLMMQYIHQNYSRPITLEDIAATVPLSKSSVRSLFCRNIHTSPIRYLVSYRLKRAAQLLSGTDRSVFSIAQDTGFENIGYFCRKFKETFHLTPTEYRRRSLQNPNQR